MSAYGSDPLQSTITDEDGEFQLMVTNPEALDLQLVKEGYMKTLFVSTVEDIDRQFQMFFEWKGLMLHQEKFGRPYDPSESLVVVEARGMIHPKGNSNEELAGTSIDLTCPYRRAWVLDDGDNLVQGNAILAGGDWSEVTFEGVEEATCEVIFEPPPGFTCSGRRQLAWIPADHRVEIPFKCTN